MQPDLRTFFDAYGESFLHGAEAIAVFFAEPCITARAGVVRINPSHETITAIFREVVEQYRARGFTHGDYIHIESRSLGTNSAFATLRWSYKDAAGSTLWENTFSYNLYRQANGWKILLQTMHDEKAAN
jgi:hypothetical protein